MVSGQDAIASGARLGPGSVYASIRFSSTRSGCLASRGDLAVGAGLGLVDSSTSSTPVFAALQIGLDSTHVYLDITQWRSRLKIINAEIAETQQDSYNDIASGIKLQDGCWLVED